MLTPEQIRTLKEGDPLIIQGTYVRQHTDGDIVIKCNVTRGCFLDTDNKYFHPLCVSIPSERGTLVPTPKYDPTRLFRKGDKVRVVAWNGRDIARVGQVGYVVENEYNSKVELAIDGWKKDIYYPVCHLELISPVEERERYSVHHSTAGIWQVIDTKDNGIISNYVDHRHPNARKSAEIEASRLNSEWRKEQNND